MYKMVYQCLKIIVLNILNLFVQSYRCMNGNIENGTAPGKMKLATTGNTWAVIRDKLPELLPRLVKQGAVFARMTSDQKQQLVLELQKMGYFVGGYTTNRLSFYYYYIYIYIT